MAALDLTAYYPSSNSTGGTFPIELSSGVTTREDAGGVSSPADVLTAVRPRVLGLLNEFGRFVGSKSRAVEPEID